MKTKHLNFVCVLLLFLFSSSLFAQDSMFKLIADATENTFTIEPYIAENLDTAQEDLFAITDEFRESYTLEPHDIDGARTLAATMLAIGAGFGFGSDQFLYCLHAAYYLQLATMGNSFLYGALGLAFNGLSNDFLTRSFLEFQLRLLMFSPITQFSQVYFLYGLLLAYGIGTEKFDSGGKYDLTAFTAAFVVGLAIILTSQLTFMVQTNALAHVRQTQKPDNGGAKIENNNTWGAINQNNLILMSLVFRF
ncbi:hypothetical protein [Algibacter sp. 2305UL17-15]|uniref:hypothetical protein n=1 Tax=Algibacter sp. 2305UL17-15 TaxID=3231268 RepID=UPI003457CA39